MEQLATESAESWVFGMDIIGDEHRSHPKAEQPDFCIGEVATQ